MIDHSNLNKNIMIFDSYNASIAKYFVKKFAETFQEFRKSVRND